MQSAPKIAVIILNWNAKKLLERFLPGVVKYTNYPDVDIVVADNGSTDDSVEFVKENFPTVKIIAFKENYGYAKGNHVALIETSCEYALFLNNDVEVTPGWLDPLRKVLDENKNVVAVQPKILSLNEPEKFEYAGACGGYIDRFGYPFCRGRILDVVEIDNGQYDTPQEVFWCSGAAFLVRREKYFGAGGFDPYFFAHMEEIDLCWRLGQCGGVLMVEPKSVVYHLGGGTLPMNHPNKLKLNYRNNILMHYKNLTGIKFYSFMFIRIFMDLASFMVFCCKREIHNAKALILAYREFYRMRGLYSSARELCGNKQKRKVPRYNGWIIWDFYVRKIVSYSELTRKL